MAEIKLKPCPFCGSDAETVSFQVADDATETWASCKHCGARTEGIEDSYSNHAGAASEWNARPLDDQLQQQREQIVHLARVHLCDWCLKGSPAGYNITDGKSDGMLYHRVDDEPVECGASRFIAILKELEAT